jgi:hypothetical protein
MGFGSKLMTNASAVVERVQPVFTEIVPNVVVRVGCTSYPHTNANAHGLFNTASRSPVGHCLKNTRLSHLTLIESDT